MRTLFKILLAALFVILFIGAGFFTLSLRSIPDPADIRYGATFSKFRADELGLDWRETYEALLTDLGVKRLRLVAHWDMVEPVDDQFNFTELDYQMRRAEDEGASVLLAVGRRLPSWPECHEPTWVDTLAADAAEAELLEYVQVVVERYRSSPSLVMWQVENEPFILFYASVQCGSAAIQTLDKEIALVRALDPETPILLTASGEVGFWNGTWIRGDVFGTTLYRWVWSGEFNRFITYPTTPAFFRAKHSLTEWTTGIEKPAILAELAAEPWVQGATRDAPLEVQYAAMNIDRLNETIAFAQQTDFREQYLWGAEWWYYLKVVHGEEAVWEWAKKIFTKQ